MSLIIRLSAHSSRNFSYIDARERFKNTVFVVKYNYHPHPEMLLLHIRIWKRVFTNQMVFVPWTQQEVENLQIRNTSVATNISVNSYMDDVLEPGYFTYNVAMIAMKRFPDATGYLYAHDDVAMDVSYLMTLKSDNFWSSLFLEAKQSRCRDMKKNWKKKNTSWWWGTPYGINAIEKLVKGRHDIARDLKKCFGSLHYWCAEQADFFYIPQRYKEVFVRVLTAFGEYKLFVEIAVPTFFSCFIDHKHLEKVPLCSFFDDNRGNITAMEKMCGARSPLFHPVKLSIKGNEEGMRRKIGLRHM